MHLRLPMGQNGSVAEAVGLWKRNVDKEFEGACGGGRLLGRCAKGRARCVCCSVVIASLASPLLCYSRRARASPKLRALAPAGQEECLICYSIIQPTSGQLPRLGCRTCRKRFHGGCLYKWFKSSGKSNCPHCQGPW